MKENINKFTEWLAIDDRKTILLTSISAICLLISILTNFKPFGIDMAFGAIIISGVPIVLGSFKRLIFHRDIKAGLLVSIALIACVAVGEYFAAGEIVVIMMIGELLEDYTVRKSKKGLQTLIDLQPTTARVHREGEYKMIDAKHIRLGDRIRVIAGETIPTDGKIIEGFTTVDQSVMTGESIPVDKTIGDEVFSATVNSNGTIVLEATKVGEDSSISRMIRMVKEAEANKAPILSVMDRWASYLVVIALVLSVLIGVGTSDVMRGITVLVVFCPCALVLATPTAIAAGIGNATRHGIIVKSGEALEKLGKVTRIAFDKTGTLTIGEPEVEKVILFNDYKENDFDTLIASAELHSEHPFGKAIVRYCKKKDINIDEPKDFEVVPGKGVTASVQNQIMIIGNKTLFDEKGISIPSSIIEQATSENEKGHTIIYVSIDGEVQGLISLADQLRDESKEVIRTLRNKNLAVTLLTGDNKRVATEISGHLGIDEFKSDLLPGDKVMAIKEYMNNAEEVCMIGDGINDAPALKTASISIAMAGIGSDIAAESADIILVKDDIAKVPYVLDLSNAVISKINQNIVISLLINFGAIALAATGWLDPVAGALVHNVGSVLVVINAAFLLRKK